jgi:hypothetical protein
MKLDTSRLDAKIRKYQMLKELLSDPEMVTACFEIISGNGHNHTEPAKTQGKGASLAEAARATTQRGELFESAKVVAAEFPDKFSASQLLTKMKEMGFQLAAKREDVAIAGVLKRLVKRDVLRKSGQRGSTRYELVR